MQQLGQPLFDMMTQRVVRLVEDQLQLDWKNIALVSGGAAWSDHIAVRIFLQKQVSSLTLYLPCTLKVEGNISFENRNSSDKTGTTANYYHQQFSQATHCDSLSEIREAIQKGAIADTSAKGFHARNTLIAKAPNLVALSWGKHAPEDGGTLNTWKKCPGNKYHISMTSIADQLSPSRAIDQKNKRKRSEDDSEIVHVLNKKKNKTN